MNKSTNSLCLNVLMTLLVLIVLHVSTLFATRLHW
jgi:hypothetical protein